jgi:hypothetical protein
MESVQLIEIVLDLFHDGPDALVSFLASSGCFQLERFVGGLRDLPLVLSSSFRFLLLGALT